MLSPIICIPAERRHQVTCKGEIAGDCLKEEPRFVSVQSAFCLVIASASLHNLSCCRCRLINQEEIGFCVLGIDAVWFGRSNILKERKLNHEEDLKSDGNKYIRLFTLSFLCSFCLFSSCFSLLFSVFFLLFLTVDLLISTLFSFNIYLLFIYILFSSFSLLACLVFLRHFSCFSLCTSLPPPSSAHTTLLHQCLLLTSTQNKSYEVGADRSSSP